MMIVPKRRDFDLLEEMFKDPFFASNELKTMKTDIKEKEDKYLIDIDLPGYSKEDIRISVENGYLIVNAEITTKEEQEDGKYVRKERYYGKCSRSFYVGENIETEDINASLKNGILCLEVPKKNEERELPETKYVEIGE